MSDASSDKDPSKKHRHDVGAVDHGPVRTVTTTKTIQVILGLAIIMTAALTIYAFVVAGSGVGSP